MKLKTAKDLNTALLLPVLAGFIFIFLGNEPPELIYFLIVQSVIAVFVILAICAKSLSRQKIFGLIPYCLVLIECVLVIMIGFIYGEASYVEGTATIGILSLIGIVKLSRVRS